MEHISRPPFDENGYAVYEGQSKKKKSTPLRWIIPAGLLAIVVLVTVILCLRPKDPNEFCREALKDAVSDSFGSGDPMIHAIGLDSVREYMMGGNYSLGTTVAVQSIDAAENTALYKLIKKIGFEPKDIPKGVGVSLGLEALEGQGAYESVSLAISMIKLVLLRAWNNREAVTIASQRLHEDGLLLNYKELRDSWQNNPAWAFVPEKNRDKIINQVQEIIEKYKINSIFTRLTEGTSPFSYFGTGYASASKALFKKITFKEAKNASGQRLQEKIHVGKENLLCYGYQASIETDEICKRIRSLVGLSTQNLHYAEGSEEIEALMFLTRKGELISLEFSTELVVYGTNVPIHFFYQASGENDPQDHFTLTLELLMKEPVTIVFTKNTTVNAYGIRTTLEATADVKERRYSASLQAAFKDGGDIVTVDANTYIDGGSVGGLQATIQVSNEEKEWSVNFKDLKLWDTYTGTAVNLTWKITAAVKEDEFSAKPPKVVHNVSEMSFEEWKEFYDKAKSNLEDYIDTLTDLF